MFCTIPWAGRPSLGFYYFLIYATHPLVLSLRSLRLNSHFDCHRLRAGPMSLKMFLYSLYNLVLFGSTASCSMFGMQHQFHPNCYTFVLFLCPKFYRLIVKSVFSVFSLPIALGLTS